MSTQPATPTLSADLEAGLKRLKLAAIRRAVPDILLTAPRDQSNARNRMTTARFPVEKTLDEFNIDESSIPRASP